MISRVSNIDFAEINRDDPFAMHRKEIEEFWDSCCRKDPSSYSETILNVFDIKESNQAYTLSMERINFYEAFYSKKTGNIKVSPLFSGGILITSDGYCCLAADKNNDINLIGGLSSLTDYSNGRYDPEICLVREFLEETGADIRGEHFSYSLKYIKTPDEDETYSPVGLIYEVRTTYGKDDIENIFNTSRHDSELGSLVFFRLEEKDIFSNNKRRPYINELFTLLSGE